jgi:DMSO/TMAO reductase YedYZ molybdopterin-dependent catalytic subunit
LRTTARDKETIVTRFTRGFSGRGAVQRDPRLLPGQYDAGHNWPVLTAEVTPRIDTESWTFTVGGLVEAVTTWSWDEIRALPGSDRWDRRLLDAGE